MTQPEQQPWYKKTANQVALISGAVAVVIAIVQHLVTAQKPEAQIVYNVGDTSKDIGRHWQHLKYSFIREEYINPKIIEELLGWISDPSTTISTIDLVIANKSNQFHTDIERRTVNGKELIGYRRDNKDGAFFYNYIGTSPSGVLILLCIDQTGGTSVFHTLLLLSLKSNNFLQASSMGTETKERVLLHSIGMISLGDRYTGDIKYENGVLTVGEDKSRNQYGLWQSSKQFEIK